MTTRGCAVSSKISNVCRLPTRGTASEGALLSVLFPDLCWTATNCKRRSAIPYPVHTKGFCRHMTVDSVCHGATQLRSCSSPLATCIGTHACLHTLQPVNDHIVHRELFVGAEPRRTGCMITSRSCLSPVSLSLHPCASYKNVKPSPSPGPCRLLEPGRNACNGHGTKSSLVSPENGRRRSSAGRPLPAVRNKTSSDLTVPRKNASARPSKGKHKAKR